MGYITNVIILLDVARPGGADRVKAKIDGWLALDADNVTIELIETPGGGSKVFTPVLLVGAFNYMDVDGFKSFLAGIDWRADDDVSIVQMWLCRESDWYENICVYSACA